MNVPLPPSVTVREYDAIEAAWPDPHPLIAAWRRYDSLQEPLWPVALTVVIFTLLGFLVGRVL